VGDFLILEGSNHVVDAINVSNVTQKMISKTLSLGGSSHDTGDINNLKNSCYFRFRFVNFA
jgi:hypothetical protein